MSINCFKPFFLGEDLLGIGVISADINDHDALVSCCAKGRIILDCVGPVSIYLNNFFVIENSNMTLISLNLVQSEDHIVFLSLVVDGSCRIFQAVYCFSEFGLVRDLKWRFIFIDGSV